MSDLQARLARAAETELGLSRIAIDQMHEDAVRALEGTLTRDEAFEQHMRLRLIREFERKLTGHIDTHKINQQSQSMEIKR